MFVATCTLVEALLQERRNWDTIAIWEARTRVYDNMCLRKNRLFALELIIKNDLVLTFASAIKDMD